MRISAPSSRQKSSFVRRAGGDGHPGAQRPRDLDARGCRCRWHPPWTNSSWPAARCAVITRFDHTVQATSGNPAASTSRRRREPASPDRRERRRTRRNRRRPAARRLLVPTDHSVTSAPTSATTPETSMPMISLAPGGGGYFPAACSTSARLTPAACTSISTSPVPGGRRRGLPARKAGRGIRRRWHACRPRY